MIDRTFNNAQATVEEANHDAINAILHAAETALLGIAIEHQLHGVSIERWRSDQPDIVMSWSPVRGMFGLGKNIRVFVLASNPSQLTCSVESNAWFDKPQPDESIIRHWDNFSGRVLQIADPGTLTQVESQRLQTLVEHAYDRIADGSEFVLGHAVLIHPDGRSQPLEASLRISNDVAAIRR